MNWVEVCHSSLPTKKSHKRSPLKRPLFWLEVGSLVLEGGKKSKRGDKQVAGTRMYNIILYIYGIHRTCMMNVQNHHSLFLLYFFAFKSAWPPISSDSFPSEIFGSSQFNNFQNPRSPPKKRRNVALTRKQPCTCTTPWSRCRVVSISFLR